MTNNKLTERLISPISSLIALFTGSKPTQEDIVFFKQALDEYEADYIDEEDDINFEEIGWFLPDIIEQSGLSTIFQVDWKDRESAIDYLEASILKEDINLKLRWSVSDPHDLTVAEIFVEANQQFQVVNYSLIGLFTGDDSFTELLLSNELLDEFVTIADELYLELDWNQSS